jgi:hypothetical protein
LPLRIVAGGGDSTIIWSVRERKIGGEARNATLRVAHATKPFYQYPRLVSANVSSSTAGLTSLDLFCLSFLNALGTNTCSWGSSGFIANDGYRERIAPEEALVVPHKCMYWIILIATSPAIRPTVASPISTRRSPKLS